MALPTPPLYDDTSISLDLSRGAVGGSTKPTRLIRMPSGREQRVKLWAGSKKRWTLPFDMRPLSQADTLVAFWEARDGGQRAFRFRDPAENTVTDQVLAPDGSPFVQLVRTFTSGSQTRTKNIFAPVTPIVVKKNAVTITPALVVYTTGVVTLPVILQKAITAISQASSAVVTVGAAHGFAVNDKVYLSGVAGMVEINGLVGTVTATAATTITLGALDSSNFTAYSGPSGTATKYLTTTDTLTWSGTYDHVARFDELQQQMVHDDAFIRSWSVPLVEVTQGSGEAEQIDPVSLSYLEFYARSVDASGTDGSSVSAVPEISGNGRDLGQATAGFRPVLRKTGANISPNGKQMIEFDGSNDQLTAVLPASGVIPSTRGHTVFCYVKEGALSTGGFNCQHIFTVNAFDLLTRTSTGDGYPLDQQYGMQGGTTGVHRGYGATALGYQVVCARWSAPPGAVTSGTMDLFVDGVQQGSGQQNWNGSMDTLLLLSANSVQNCAFSGAWGATVWISDTLSDQTVRGVSAFLKAFFEGS
jgi:uncharacterized protein (TIGR02217 family)